MNAIYNKKSAGILAYRRRDGGLEVLLVHPGGPFWKGKDEGAWSIPKGEIGEGEDPFEAAKREFGEETGICISGCFEPLGPAKQPSGKIIYAWTVEADVDTNGFRSNSFSMEWPRGSGVVKEFPEVDKVVWFPLHEARRKIAPGQLAFLDQLERRIKGSMSTR